MMKFTPRDHIVEINGYYVRTTDISCIRFSRSEGDDKYEGRANIVVHVREDLTISYSEPHGGEICGPDIMRILKQTDWGTFE